MNAIEIQGLTKRYGPITAVDGLDLTCLLYTSDAADDLS